MGIYDMIYGYTDAKATLGVKHGKNGFCKSQKRKQPADLF